MRNDAFSNCHPLTNFVFFLGAIGFSVVIQHPAYLLVSFLAGACYYLALSGGKGWKLIWGLMPLFFLVALINPLFNTYGQRVLFMPFGRPYTLEALLYGTVIAGMLVVMMLWFSCYSAVLTSDKFICLFGSRIPSLSMLLVMVLRMIPNLMMKARQIAGARRSIGKGVSEQNTNKEKLHDGMSILSSLTDWALEGSIVTADSMRSRGYGTARRSSFQIYRFTARDRFLLGAMVLLAALTLALGGTGATFTPELNVAKPTLGLAAYGLFLFLPVLLGLKEDLRWKIAVSNMTPYSKNQEKL